ncbi:MAG: hypothetical protein ACLVIY_01425 [Anaerobutyricum soehngenii]
MKILLPIIYIITFIIGIFFIITADTGLITSYYQALIAGVIISCFAGIFLAIYLHEWHIEKTKQLSGTLVFETGDIGILQGCIT